MVIAGVILAGLAATGRLNWVFAVIGALLPFVRRSLTLLNYAPLFQRLYRQYSARSTAGGGGTGGQQSKWRRNFQTDSGSRQRRDARPGDGWPVPGKALEQLTLEQLLMLLQECRRDDRESAQLHGSHLDRTHGDEWRSEAQAARTPAALDFPNA